MREHLLGAWKATGQRPQALDTPPPPESLRPLLDWFIDFGAGRQAGYAEPAALTWAEMQAWQQINDIALEPWQARVLRNLDRLWLATWRAGREKPSKTKE